MKPIIFLYLLGTLLAAFTAVAMSFLFPTTLTLVTNTTSIAPPEGIAQVINSLFFKIVDNPINALMNR